MPGYGDDYPEDVELDCELCDGTGECPECDGEPGEDGCTFCDETGRCPDCGGKGFFYGRE